MRVIITTVARGYWYPKGYERMRDAFAAIGGDYEFVPWIDELPPGTPECVENGVDYTAYAAKPFALADALGRGADVAILLDASFYPVRPIQPLVHHIEQTGHYFCRNGFNIGEWTSDRCLEAFGVPRESTWGCQDISSYCVGVKRSEAFDVPEDLQPHVEGCVDGKVKMATIADHWCMWTNPANICGAHTNSGYDGRNRGHVSHHPKVRGHRHDQSVLSLLVHRLGLDHQAVARPKFTAYAGSETHESVLVCRGMAWR